MLPTLVLDNTYSLNKYIINPNVMNNYSIMHLDLTVFINLQLRILIFCILFSSQFFGVGGGGR